MEELKLNLLEEQCDFQTGHSINQVVIELSRNN